jgi:hypothetical protein
MVLGRKAPDACNQCLVGCELVDNAGLDFWDQITGVLSVSNLGWPSYIVENSHSFCSIENFRDNFRSKLPITVEKRVVD